MTGKIIKHTLQPLSEAEQQQLAADLQADYNIHVSRFDVNTGEPILGYEDKQTLVNALCEDIAQDSAEIISHDEREARCKAVIILNDGRRYDRTGFCLIGEQLGDGEQVTTSQQAVAIAQGRAYNAVLRAINFSPIRAYRQLKSGSNIEPPTPELSGEEGSLRKRLHALAEEAGYITHDAQGTSKGRYHQLLQAIYGVNTSAPLDASQILNLCNFLQAEINRNKQQQRAAA